MNFISSRSVLSSDPTSDPVWLTWSAKSSRSRSITAEVTLPRLAMVTDSSRISSSSMNENSFAA